MLRNADCTFYRKDFTRRVCRGCYWNDSRGASVTRSGVQVADAVVIYLYDGYLPQVGDLVVMGVQEEDFPAATQAEASQSMRRFRELFPDFVVVQEVRDCRYGGLPHVEVNAK